jgi:hypothetical protein
MSVTSAIVFRPNVVLRVKALAISAALGEGRLCGGRLFFAGGVRSRYLVAKITKVVIHELRFGEVHLALSVWRAVGGKGSMRDGYVGRIIFLAFSQHGVVLDARCALQIF